jgi:hypothetical protein
VLISFFASIISEKVRIRSRTRIRIRTEYLGLMDPDLGGPKTCRSCGSGYPTLDQTILVEAHWFQCGSRSGSSILGQCGSGSSSGPGSRVLMIKKSKILQQKNSVLSNKLPTIYSQASMKDAQATEEAFRPRKRTSSTSKHVISKLSSIFVDHFCPTRSGSKADQNQCGSRTPGQAIVNFAP